MQTGFGKVGASPEEIHRHNPLRGWWEPSVHLHNFSVNLKLF